jgi:hypothetical protein
MKIAEIHPKQTRVLIENSDRPKVYKNLDEEKICQPKVLDFYQIFVNSKKKSKFWERNS